MGHSFVYRKPAAVVSTNRRSFISGAIGACVASGPTFAMVSNPGDTLDEIIKRGSIVIGMYSDYAPYSFLENGEIKGTDVEIAKLIAAGLKVKPELQLRLADEDVDADLRDHVWRGSSVGEDVVNVFLHMPIAHELSVRNDMVVMGGAYASEKIVLGWRKSQLGDVPTMGSFTDHSIAVENSSMADFFLTGTAGGALVKNMIHKPTFAAAMKEMIESDASAVMGPKAQIEYELKKAGVDRAKYGVGVVTPPGLSQGNWSFGFAVRVNYHELFYAIEEIINAAMADGRIKAIYEQFGLTYSPPAIVE